MSDLLQRLRAEDTEWPPSDPLYMGLRREAADEIERLDEIVLRLSGTVRLYRMLEHSQSDATDKEPR